MTQAEPSLAALRKISSDTAEFHKVVFPFFGLVILGLFILVMLLAKVYLMALVLAAVWGLMFWGAKSEASVMAEAAYCGDDHFLLKVNGEEIIIPFKEVKCIYFSPGRPDTIGIGTKSVYPLGEDLRFVPEGGSSPFSAFTDHPLLAELKTLVKAARSAAVVIGKNPYRE